MTDSHTFKVSIVDWAAAAPLLSKIRREVSKLAMGHAADGIHDHYRGVDAFAFHEEYAKFDSGLNDDLIGTC